MRREARLVLAASVRNVMPVRRSSATGTKTRLGILGILAIGLAFMAITVWINTSPESSSSAGAAKDPERAAVSAAAPQSRVAPDESLAFDKLSVQFGGMWVWWQDTHLIIKGDGAVDFSTKRVPNDDVRYSAQFYIGRKHLAELAGRLKKTDWLTKAGANQEPDYSDATRIDMELKRRGKVQTAWCHDRNAQPYLSLVNFLKRIRRQENLLNRAVAAGERERANVFREIGREIRSARGVSAGDVSAGDVSAGDVSAGDVSAGDGLAVTSAYPILDYNRFVPVSMDIILHPDENHEDTVVTALEVLAMLKIENARQRITTLTTAAQSARDYVSPEYRTGIIGEAAVESLTVLGGPQAREHIRGMAQNHRMWESRVNVALAEALLKLDRDGCADLLKEMASSTAEAAWGLVRLGPAGLPAILTLLEEHDSRNMGQVNLVRQYIGHWEELPSPIDGRVIEAVRKNLDYRLGYSRDWTGYHRELLQLAGAAGLPVSCPREISESFLTAVKNNDKTAMDGIVVPASISWPEQVGKLTELLKRQGLAVTKVYADKGNCMALATAAGRDEKENGRALIYLNYCSGAVWRVSAVSIQTPEQTSSACRRFLEKYPDSDELIRNKENRLTHTSATMK